MLIVLLLAALVAFAFLPSVRAAGKTDFTSAVRAEEKAGAATAAAESKIDEQAMLALEKARAYVAEHDFEVKYRAEIKAKAYGIPHTQKVSGKRSVKDGAYFEQAESKSTFVKAAVRKASSADGYDVSRGEYKNGKFVYGKPKHMTTEKFIAAYGKPATGLVRYELDGTILQATKVDEGVYKYKLDAKQAAEFSKNEVKTLTDTKKHPVYKSVSFTLYCDGDRPIKVTTREKFTADICGGTDCTASYTETFTFAE